MLYCQYQLEPGKAAVKQFLMECGCRSDPWDQNEYAMAYRSIRLRSCVEVVDGRFATSMKLEASPSNNFEVPAV